MNETPYRRSSEVLWRNVGPEVLLTRPGVETTEVLSETAAEAWRVLERPGTAHDVAARLGGFAGRPDEIAIGVNALLLELVQRGHCTRDHG